jgi:hypothetical protein
MAWASGMSSGTECNMTWASGMSDALSSMSDVSEKFNRKKASNKDRDIAWASMQSYEQTVVQTARLQRCKRRKPHRNFSVLSVLGNRQIAKGVSFKLATPEITEFYQNRVLLELMSSRSNFNSPPNEQRKTPLRRTRTGSHGSSDRLMLLDRPWPAVGTTVESERKARRRLRPADEQTPKCRKQKRRRLLDPALVNMLDSLDLKELPDINAMQKSQTRLDEHVQAYNAWKITSEEDAGLSRILCMLDIESASTTPTVPLPPAVACA